MPKDEEDRLSDLAEKFKVPRGMSTEERDEMFELLSTRREEDPDFKIKSFSDAHGYDKRTYNRLRKLMQPALRGKRDVVERTLGRAEQKDLRKFIRDWWSSLREIGENVILTYGSKAAERGMDIKDYVTTALKFYDEHGDRVEELELENQQLKVMGSMLVEATRPGFRRLAALRIYADYISELLRFRALGVEVPDWALTEVREKVEEAIA